MSLGSISLHEIIATILLLLLVWRLKRVFDIYGHIYWARYGWQRTTAPRHYVRALFDGYAKEYDEHLLRKLKYKGPNLISHALNRWLDGHSRDIGLALDLGCGTGICGALLTERVERLIGVDLSPRMLGEAVKRKVYDELHEADAVEYLRGTDEPFDLITAADVLVYIGDLTPLMEAVGHSLSSDGLFIFTTETIGQSGYRLLTTGRFGHHRDYVLELAWKTGLEPISVEEVVLREEFDEPVMGELFVLHRSSSTTVE